MLKYRVVRTDSICVRRPFFWWSTSGHTRNMAAVLNDVSRNRLPEGWTPFRMVTERRSGICVVWEEVPDAERL